MSSIMICNKRLVRKIGYQWHYFTFKRMEPWHSSLYKHCVEKSSYFKEIILPNIIGDGFKLFTPQKWTIWINFKYESAFDVVLFLATDPKTSVWYAPPRRQCPEVTFATPDANFLEFVRLWNNSQIGGFWKKCDNDSSWKQNKRY